MALQIIILAKIATVRVDRDLKNGNDGQALFVDYLTMASSKTDVRKLAAKGRINSEVVVYNIGIGTDGCPDFEVVCIGNKHLPTIGPPYFLETFNPYGGGGSGEWVGNITQSWPTIYCSLEQKCPASDELYRASRPGCDYKVEFKTTHYTDPYVIPPIAVTGWHQATGGLVKDMTGDPALDYIWSYNECTGRILAGQCPVGVSSGTFSFYGYLDVPVPPLTISGPDAYVPGSYAVSGGVAPYVWSYPTGCGMGIVSVTDSCGTVASKTVRMPVGQWITVTDDQYIPAIEGFSHYVVNYDGDTRYEEWIFSFGCKIKASISDSITSCAYFAGIPGCSPITIITEYTCDGPQFSLTAPPALQSLIDVAQAGCVTTYGNVAICNVNTGLPCSQRGWNGAYTSVAQVDIFCNPISRRRVSTYTC